MTNANEISKLNHEEQDALRQAYHNHVVAAEYGMYAGGPAPKTFAVFAAEWIAKNAH